MIRFVVVAAAAGLLLPGTAHAAQHDGTTCGMVAVLDPTDGVDEYVALVETGPVRANAPTDAITVACTIQVGSAFHGGPAAATVTVTGTGVATGTVAVARYHYPEPVAEVYLCTRWTVNGVDHRYDAPSATFTTGAAECDRAFQQELDVLPSSICAVVVPPGLCVHPPAPGELHGVTPKPASADTP